MDLDFSKEQKILMASARDFLKKECPKELVREMKDDERGYPPSLWKKMADLGWLGVIIPEECGGTGGDFLDLSILLEAMGEACLPGPFFSTVVLGGMAIQLAGSSAQKDLLLGKIADGSLILTLALAEPGNWYGASKVSMRAVEQEDEFIINGTKLFVENAHIADYIICVARTDEGESDDAGLSLFLIDGNNPGIKCNLLQSFAYDKQCEVVFENVRIPKDSILGAPGRAAGILETLQERAAVGKCAELVGCTKLSFDMTIAYAKEREQFGRPIGSFQAVQHHCANMAVDVDSSRFLTYQAAWKIAEGLPVAKEAAMAKAWTSDASCRVTRLAHQIHGAIAFCEEHDLHLYYRRAKAGAVAFGDGEYHLEKVARELGL